MGDTVISQSTHSLRIITVLSPFHSQVVINIIGGQLAHNVSPRGHGGKFVNLLELVVVLKIEET